MLVEDILAQKGGQVFAVDPDCTVREMARFIATRNIGTTIVTDKRGEMLGIISERDLSPSALQIKPGHCPNTIRGGLARSRW